MGWHADFRSLHWTIERVAWIQNHTIQDHCRWTSFSMASGNCFQMARDGDLEGLKAARQNGCPWDEDMCTYAAQGGHLPVLQWARQNGCPWDEETCSGAAFRGHLPVLQWAQQNGCPWDEDTCAYADQGGHLPVLQWARQNGCPWDEEEIKSNLKKSSNQLLNFYGPRRWLERELGISWSSSGIQWMDATDEALDVELDAMLISDLSNLIKKYV